MFASTLIIGIVETIATRFSSLFQFQSMIVTIVLIAIAILIDGTLPLAFGIVRLLSTIGNDATTLVEQQQFKRKVARLYFLLLPIVATSLIVRIHAFRKIFNLVSNTIGRSMPNRSLQWRTNR
jgi:hypothetical protein